MTLNEFRAWLEGYSASFGDAPNADQWATICAKMAGVEMPSLRQTFTLPTVLGSPSTNPYPVPPYTTCGLVTEPLGAEFSAVWDTNVETLYQS